ncbi:DUF6497 family protein [Tabrizicola sp. YIM 78059]|uniref:DUF6497 family protein n=1 Tax=Tabrizicola sp. YIM 78059 TaxID=2529861 RepID=UPI0020BF93FE|nr:DUF6497 family protein [Tabrizicola sp. YIM 78059]
MMDLGRLIPAILILSGLSACQDEAPAPDAISVPSGRALSLIEVVTNVPGPEGATARFRYLAPGLKPEEAAAAQDDMQVLCDEYALPRTSGMVPAPRQIIISLSAEKVPFGQAAPGVVQFFEAYSLQDGACMWEQF